jgi:hypothetical protein
VELEPVKIPYTELTHSAGTGALANRIIEISEDPSSYPWDVMVFDLQTIVRNCLQKDQSDDNIYNLAIKDIGHLLNMANIYWSKYPAISKPRMVFYLHETYLGENARSLSKNKEAVVRISRMLKRLNEGRPADYEPFGKITVATVFGESESATNFLLNAIAGVDVVSKAIRRGDLAKHLFITHNPINTHVMPKFSNAELLESFTGKILRYGALDNKVLKTEFLPFCPSAHLLLGDNVYVKPLIKGKVKQELIEAAKENLMKYKTNDQIIEFVKKQLPDLDVMFVNKNL